MDIINAYKQTRNTTVKICKPLKTEDYVPQPMEDVSPPKWHFGHTSWFFETFILKEYYKDYKEFHPTFAYIFNSYYESEGEKLLRSERGTLSRPTVEDIYEYRQYIDKYMLIFLEKGSLRKETIERIILGLQHEQQHQELLITDIKYILGINPLHPIYTDHAFCETLSNTKNEWISIPEGLNKIGYEGNDFCFDNEKSNHKIHINAFEISSNLVTNKEFIEFIEHGGYTNFNFWHAEAWNWLQQNKITAPLYWNKNKGTWKYYTLAGLKSIKLDAPVCHISYYEAFAYAQWKNVRLPTEFEWEIASEKLSWGQRWEWTESAYLPYPKYKKEKGAIGEYNGKFMVNQKVLRGASVATAQNHSRRTYRNFFHPNARWQFTGIRLAK